MKNLIMTFAAAVGLSLGSFAQSATAESKAFRSSQIVAPYDIEVTYNKTVHVLFPAAVQYVDLGSNDIIAGRASGAENVVRIKSAVAGFTGETQAAEVPQPVTQAGVPETSAPQTEAAAAPRFGTWSVHGQVGGQAVLGRQ